MKTTLTHQYIIAIGTSAGGVEALESFFDHTFPDGVSYVIIQHLSVDYQSRLAHIISKHSKLEICEATQGMPVEVNKVYVIPHNKYMTIRKGAMHLTNKLRTVSPHFTIDTFFKSLAEERGNKAIGVVLTGIGKDGTAGIKAIHKAGGIVLVQDPLTAKYRDMPDSAIGTGFVNQVLATSDMPKAIETYVLDNAYGYRQGSEENHQEAEASNREEAHLMAILELINSQMPYDFSGYKQGTIKRRISRRMAATHTESLEAYRTYLQSNPEEVAFLANDLLIHVTAFFRDEEEFTYLQTTIIPAIVDNHPQEDILKIWCAGCATGEEAYSLAIVLSEYLQRTSRQLEVKIFATDIDKKMIGIASKGIYSESTAKNVSQERLANFFTRIGNTFKVKPELRKMLVFATHDLVKNPPYCHMDLVSCRNVLIYMTPVLQQKVLSILNFGLKQGGYLFLGSSETAKLTTHAFAEINKKWKVYQKTGSWLETGLYSFSAPVIEDIKILSFPDVKGEKKAYVNLNLIDDIHEVVMHASGYAGVCLDKNLTILQTFGDLSPYLLPKVLNFNLAELLPRSLSGIFGAAVHRAIKHNERVVLKRIQVKEESPLLINVLIEPFVVRKTAQKLIVVLFSEDHPVEKEPRQESFFDHAVHTSEYIADMEAELREARENLQQVFEKIEAFNENRQSFNEELLSANEEMQSANEELQSVNEELQTINIEHGQKIKELLELNDDFTNYFRSNVNRQLYVDKDLLLKKFSPAVFTLINLKETDLGRPIDHITTNLQSGNLIADLKQVLTTGEILVRELQDVQGRWYQVTTMPYIRQTGNQQDGAIITFNDITRLKLAQQAVDQSNESLRRINADLDNFVYAASHDLLGPLSAIEGLVYLLRAHPNAGDVKLTEYNTMLDASIQKFKATIQELARVGKIESQQLEDQASINLKELLGDIKLSLLDKITASNANIQENLEETEIKFSRKNLRSILYNLISNAIKFTPAGRRPEIIIRTKANAGFVQLSISDNGIGIAEEDRGSIFTKYQRLNPHTDGQGIGLYLVNKIVDATGGKIEITGNKGQGTTFTIFFNNHPSAERVSNL
ncbi:CheR family methyltransferase [Rhodocytophaga aerolata]|uniref:protein-glutamate O-methyltransferase n=1 Tax=Rhodocytophaga aerolata TaxID=455078 RepID=A0ABT8REI8_9BACT|nr:CheR family methyltransferase [Rhodocytophaga aerolata]MDO1450530.1 CheR family methyltransferase [Rhodocytophaga aerolata]